MTPQITRITRQDIVDAIQEENIVWSGRLSEVECLNKIFDLDKLPSNDRRCPNAAGDIYLHRETFRDWDDDWVFYDERFDLMGCDNETFLEFLCHTVHPEVRSDASDIDKIVIIYNRSLANDGFQLIEESRLSGRPIYTGRFVGVIATAAIASARKAVAGTDSGYINQQLSRMEEAATKDPDLAIGTAKEFVETCCNTILEDRGVSISGKPDLPQLTKRTSSVLRLTPEDIPEKAKAVGKIRRVLSNLASITQGLAELRNSYGTGHGRSARRRGLNSRHAKLAVGAAATLGVFLLETHKEQMSDENTAAPGDA